MKLIMYSKEENGFFQSNLVGRYKGWRDPLWTKYAARATIYTKTQARKVTIPNGAVWIKYNRAYMCADDGDMIVSLTPKELIKLAKEDYHDPGTCEVDDKAKVSRDDEGSPSDGGCYVQAWVWVYYPHADYEEVTL